MVSLKDIVNRIKEATGFSQTLVATNVFGISVENLSNKIRRNTIDTNLLVSWAENNGYDLNWLLTGKGEPNLKAIEDPDRFTRIQEPPCPHGRPPNAIELGHGDIIKQFSDKTYARDLNKCLLELERLDPVAYREVGGIIKGVVLGLHRKSCREGHPPTDRRRTDRRAETRPDLIPNGKDRRTGAERRSTSGGKE